MLASKLIEALQELIDEGEDLECFFDDMDYGSAIVESLEITTTCGPYLASGIKGIRLS